MTEVVDLKLSALHNKSDKFVNMVVAQMLKDGESRFTVEMYESIFRRYLKALDVEQHRGGDTNDIMNTITAVAGDMMLHFILRTIPTNNAAMQVEVLQGMINGVAANINGGLEVYRQAPPSTATQQ